MQNLNKKRTTLIGVIIITLLILFVIYIFFFREKEEEYTGEPITQESLPSNDIGEIDTKDLRVNEQERYRIWGVSNQTSLSNIEDMISTLNINIPLQEEKEGSYYNWRDEKGNFFQYSLLRNSLIFNLVNGIPWDEVTLTHNSFSVFVNRYFDVSWKYELTSTLDLPDQEKLYYAKRLTEDEIAIERTPNLYQETDYLILKNGRIIAGEIFLTYFFDTDILVPLLNSNDISRYINEPNYPKIMNVRPDQIASALGMDDEYSYMDMEILELQQSVDNCRAINHSVVYLYKSFEQEFLTPVYRLTLECVIEYEASQHSIPAVAYVNAVDPQYIAVPE